MFLQMPFYRFGGGVLHVDVQVDLKITVIYQITNLHATKN